MNVSLYSWASTPNPASYYSGWNGYATAWPQSGYYPYQPYYGMPQQISVLSPQPPLREEPRPVKPFITEKPQEAFDPDAFLKNFPAFQKPEKHEHKATTGSRLGSLLAFGGLITGALLLHRLPGRNTFSLISSDWKDWARIVMGVLAVGSLNKALDWKPPTWLAALETVGVIAPLALGFKADGLKQLLVMAPLVAGVVTGAAKLHEAVDKKLEQEYKIPPLVTRLAISVGMAILGLKLYPVILKQVAKTGFLGQEIQKNANKAAVGIGTIVCSRGCCTSAICLSEIGEMAGAFVQWIKDDKAMHKKVSGGFPQ
jgi:hypothetical protein